MNPSEKVLAILMAIIIVSALITDRYFRVKERDVASARQNWLDAYNARKEWFALHPFKTKACPEAQWLLRIETGAFMLYLGKKDNITKEDEIRLENISSSIVSDISAEKPL